MGTINLNIEYLTYSNKQHLKDFDCYGCKVPFNDKDLEDENFILGVSDYANNIIREGGTPWDQRTKLYKVVMWLKGAEHKNCPSVERCEDCMTRYRTEDMRQSAKDKEWYCLKTCWQDHAETRRDAVPSKRKR